MRRGLVLGLVLGVVVGLGAAVAIGCSGRISEGTPLDPDAGTAVVGDASVAARAPYRVTCSVYHRDLGAGVTEHAQKAIVLMTDQPSEVDLVIPEADIPVHAKLAPAADAPELVELTLAFPRSGLERRFLLSREEMPPYELIGSHGFTGLNYVTTPDSGVDVQFICEASPRDEERPKAPAPSSGGSPTPEGLFSPFRLQCEVSVGEGPAATTETLPMTGPVKQAFNDIGGQRLAIELFDDPFEGRSFVVRFDDVVQQLYQLDRTQPIVDVTRGAGGLTGWTTVRPTTPSDGGAGDGGAGDGGEGDVVRIACRASD